MATTKYVLRDLPGAADFAVLTAKVESHPNPNWAPEYDQLEPAEERLSLDWFGLSFMDSYDAELSAADEAAFDARKESLFDRTEKELIQAMAELGWDVSDGAGELHAAFWPVHRALILATMGLAGRLPDQPVSDEEAQARATDWGASLEAEAAKFSSKPHRGRHDR